MKKLLLILTLIASTFFANAQEAKPTKEQTIEYIKTNYPRDIYVGASYNFKDPGYEPYYQGFKGGYSIRLDIVKDTVTMRYIDSLQQTFISKLLGTVEQLHHRNTVIIKFALKDIEAMGGQYTNYVGDYKATVEKVSAGCFPFYIIFFATGGKKLISQTYNGTTEQVASISMPFTNVCKNDGGFNVLEVTQTQIYKAFNHLRKLYGAPEPVKFE